MSPFPHAPTRRVSRRAVRATGALLLAAGAVLLNLWFWGATVRDEPVLVALREVPAGQLLAAGDLGRRAGRLPAETRARAFPPGRAEDLLG
ncbi:MAG: hypothetical protein IT340_23785, partial [Chloroflexi bacterium]|nr:hypothetical protein [Chloroflexota bacterium]